MGMYTFKVSINVQYIYEYILYIFTCLAEGVSLFWTDLT